MVLPSLVRVLAFRHPPSSQHEARYVQAVPNNAFYKRPIVVQRLQNSRGKVFRHWFRKSRNVLCTPDSCNTFGALEVGLPGQPAHLDWRMFGVRALVFRMSEGTLQSELTLYRDIHCQAWKPACSSHIPSLPCGPTVDDIYPALPIIRNIP